MKLHIDQEADALYLRLDDSAIVESEEVAPGVVLDYNEANQIVGIEMHLRSLRAGAHFTLPLKTLTQSESLHPRIRNCMNPRPQPRPCSLAN